MDKSPTNNKWWPLALSSELDNSGPMARLCGGRAYVLFRDARGVAHILDDQCAHRRAPLSLGRLTPEGWLQCPYHGWCFEGKSGACKKIPNLAKKESIPGQYWVGHFASVERDGMIFLWDGDSGTADPSLLPDWRLVGSRSGQAAIREGQCLVTLPQANLVATLLDAPSLPLATRHITLVDDHLLGEPEVSDAGLVVERVADWTEKARRRKRIPADYPLVVRIALDRHGAVALVEIRDDVNATPLLSAVVATIPVTDCVSAVRWRWLAHALKERELAAVPATARGKLDFALDPAPEPTRLVGVHPYVSSIWRGELDAPDTVC